MLSQLVYVSQRKPACSDQEIDLILSACQRNNASLGITGVLLYSPTQFIQYVEGDSRQLLSLYDKIKGDPRHQHVRMISHGPIQGRAFPSWQMGCRPISGQEVDFRTDVGQDRHVFHQLLLGKPQEGSLVLQLLRKFFL